MIFKTTVAHICKHIKQISKHNSIIEAQHNVIRTQHGIIEAQHNVIGTRHGIIKTQHNTSKHNSVFAKHNANLPKHNTIFAKHNTKFSRLRIVNIIQSINPSLLNRWHALHFPAIFVCHFAWKKCFVLAVELVWNLFQNFALFVDKR